MFFPEGEWGGEMLRACEQSMKQMQKQNPAFEDVAGQRTFTVFQPGSGVIFRRAMRRNALNAWQICCLLKPRTHVA
jgi:hypothetical protein